MTVTQKLEDALVVDVGALLRWSSRNLQKDRGLIGLSRYYGMMTETGRCSATMMVREETCSDRTSPTQAYIHKSAPADMMTPARQRLADPGRFVIFLRGKRPINPALNP